MKTPLHGGTGIAHTRWATHGVPSERNAHPHISRDGLAIVHNGIIENHEELREELKNAGYVFSSETDTEVVAHRIHFHMQTLGDLFKAVRATVAELEGAYALVAWLSEQEPERLIVARMGCPVVIGIGEHENFVASDVSALAAGDAQVPVPGRGRHRRCAARERQDTGRRGQHRRSFRCASASNRPKRREKGPYAHFMLKEIHEQPWAVSNTLQGTRGQTAALLEARVSDTRRRPSSPKCNTCTSWPSGTSWHAGVWWRKYFIEQVCRIPARVEIASDIPLSQPGGAGERAVRQHLAVRRNRRHAGGAAPREARELSCDACHLQRAGELAGDANRTW